MARHEKIKASDEAWETGQLGQDEEFVKVAKNVDESKIDESLELHPVSIRLQKSLIEDFKMIAKLNGIGYQPLMRQVLSRFAECEKKQIIRALLTERGELDLEDDDPPLEENRKTA